MAVIVCLCLTDFYCYSVINIHHFRSTYKLLDFCYPKTLYQIVSKI